MITPEVEGCGGIQYVGRLALRVVSEACSRDARPIAVSILDSSSQNESYSIRGANGSRVRATLSLVWQLSRCRWDLIILGHVHLSPLLLLAKRLSSAPVVGMAYGLEMWQPLNGLRRRGLMHVDRLLYISEHSRQTAYGANPWLGQVPDAVCYLGLLPEGTERAERSAEREQQGVKRNEQESDAGFALSIGRMSKAEQYKGHEEMIRVWPDVQRHRPGLELVLIGDGDDRSRLQRMASDMGVKIRFLGGVDDTTRDEMLAKCRCFCLPSRGEGFGLVFLEAMREGKPVLAGDSDAGREVVVDGVTGRTVDARNKPQLLDGILEVSGERALEMGAAGRRRYEEQFCYEVFAQRLTEHIRAIQHSPRNVPSETRDAGPGF